MNYAHVTKHFEKRVSVDKKRVPQNWCIYEKMKKMEANCSPKSTNTLLYMRLHKALCMVACSQPYCGIERSRVNWKV